VGVGKVQVGQSLLRVEFDPFGFSFLKHYETIYADGGKKLQP
jgi:hypothetical protein